MKTNMFSREGIFGSTNVRLVQKSLTSSWKSNFIKLKKVIIGFVVNKIQLHTQNGTTWRTKKHFDKSFQDWTLWDHLNQNCCRNCFSKWCWWLQWMPLCIGCSWFTMVKIKRAQGSERIGLQVCQRPMGSNCVEFQLIRVLSVPVYNCAD